MSRHSLRSLSQDELGPLNAAPEPSESQDSLVWRRLEKGQTLVEYALIIALVAIVVIAALVLLGPAIANTFNNIIHTL